LQLTCSELTSRVPENNFSMKLNPIWPPKTVELAIDGLAENAPLFTRYYANAGRVIAQPLATGYLKAADFRDARFFGVFCRG